MGHPQPGPTPVTTNNSTAVGLTMDVMIPKAPKVMDMRFKWLKCRWAQSLFCYLEAREIKNRGDYPRKHHFCWTALSQSDTQMHFLYLHRWHLSWCKTSFLSPSYFFMWLQQHYLLDAHFLALARVCWSVSHKLGGIPPYVWHRP